MPGRSEMIERYYEVVADLLQRRFVVVVIDWRGQPVAAVESRDGVVRTRAAVAPARGSKLLDVDGILYEISSVPIRVGGEEVASLVIGQRFDLKSHHVSGESALVRSGRIALTSLDTAPADFGAPEILDRVRAKLEREPVEDYRIDFEDGYGVRPDADEDAAAIGRRARNGHRRHRRPAPGRR